MSSVSLLKEIMNKTSLTTEKLAKRANVDEKALDDFLNERTKLDIEDYMKVGKFFNLSLDTLVTGNPTEQDKYTISKLGPSVNEMLENYLDKCKKIIIDAGFEHQLDEFLPKPIYMEKRGVTFVKEFTGGIFYTNDTNTPMYYWYKQDTPIIDMNIILEKDDYDLFEKLRRYPAVFMEKKRAGIGSRKELFSKLNFEDIVNLSDVRFFKEFDLSQGLSSVLYQIKDSNKNYWEIIHVLLEKGAYLEKGNLGESWSARSKDELIDYPATQMLKFIAKENIK